MLTSLHTLIHTPSHTTHALTPSHPLPRPPTQVVRLWLTFRLVWVAGLWTNISQDGPWRHFQLTVDQTAVSQAFFAFSVGADPVNSSRQTIFVSVPEWCACVNGWGTFEVCVHVQYTYSRDVCMCAFCHLTPSMPLEYFIECVCLCSCSCLFAPFKHQLH